MTAAALRRDMRLALLKIASGLKPPPRALPPAPGRILIVRPDHLGDLILAWPSVAALRRAFPAARLVGWLGPWGEPAWRGHPALDGIETCPFPGFARGATTHPLAPYLLALREAGRLAGRFDLAINLRFDFWWGAMVTCWAGIPTLGFGWPECRPFLTHPVPYHAGLHETDQNLRLVAAAAGREIEAGWDGCPVPGEDPPPGLPAGAIAIHPGAGASVKLWQEDRWAEVATQLRPHGPVVLTAGSDAEVAMAERIRRRSAGPVTVAHGLSLAQLAGFYRRCRLVIGPDNGPLHLARAMGAPTVTLFGPTDPGQFGPRLQEGGRHEVVRLPWRCIPCRRLDYTARELAYHPCVKLIECDRVLAAARRLLAAAE